MFIFSIFFILLLHFKLQWICKKNSIMKKIKIFYSEKKNITQNDHLFNSLKQKDIILEMTFKIIHYIQTWPPSRLRKNVASSFSKFDSEKLSTWLLSSGQEFDKRFLDSKHVLKMYFKPSRKNPDFFYFYHFPLSLSGWKFTT